MKRWPIVLVILVLVLLLVAVSVQSNRATTSAPAARAPAAAPTATPTATATPIPPTATPIVAASVPRDVPDTCPVTRPPNPPFVPPAPWPPKAPYGEFWYGTEALWTPLRPDGTWRYGSQYGNGPYPQKIFLWKVGYSVQAEPQPKITIRGKRLDAAAPEYVSSGGTNANHSDFGGWVMLWVVDLPSLGCWELTIEHAGHQLSFVVWVTR